jgi:cytochrome c-type biogenesis protein CcmH
MSAFWFVAALMLIIALAFLLPPLLRREQQATVKRDALNAGIYRDQLTELENDLAAGNLSRDQFEQAACDLQRRLLEDVSGAVEKHAAPAGKPSGRATAVVIALAVPVLSAALYLQLDHVRENPMAQAGGAEGEFFPQMMVQRLEQRLKEHPADSEGWLMLARSYSVMQRYADARDAYAKAMPLVDGNPDLLADYAEAVVLGSPEQRITRQSADLFEKTLRLDPDQPKALWFTGMAAFQDGEYRSAVTIWRRLEKLIPDDMEGVKVIRQGIAEAEARAAQGAAARQAP